MKGSTEGSIVLSFFLVLFGLMNYYVLVRIGSLLGLEHGMKLQILVLLLTISFIFARFITAYAHNVYSKALYFLTGSWMGILFIALCTLISFEILRFFIPIRDLTVGVLVVIITALLSSTAIANAHTTVIRHITLKKHVKKKIDIIMLSDIHIGPLKSKGYLKKLVTKLNKIKADVIVISGDLFDGPGYYKPDTFEPFNDIKIPILFTLGNHDRYTGIETVKALLSKTKVKLLRNETHMFKDMEFIGIDDAESNNQVEHVMKKMKLSNDKTKVLIYHRPAGYEYAASRGVDVMLSGHVHAGQIFPFTLLVKLSYTPVKGLYQFGKLHLYVNPGTSTWGPYMRLGSRNEIVHLTIEPLKGA